jgi:hypothetical protein
MMSEELSPSLLLYLLPHQSKSEPVAAAVGIALDAIGAAQAISGILPTPAPHAVVARSSLHGTQDACVACSIYIHEPVIDIDGVS